MNRVEPDLFSFDWMRPKYPDVPGSKARQTSRDAARSMIPKAITLRQSCFDLIKGCDGLTADEAASLLGESILSIRPRFAELSRLGLIVDSGRRHANSSGRMAIVWKVGDLS